MLLFPLYGRNILYFIGPGSTTKEIPNLLNFKGTLLGVDAILNRKLIGADLSSGDIQRLIKEKGEKGIKIIVTVIGSQGYLFGRGNQQFTPDILEQVGKENIIVVATKDKLLEECQ
ncbi:hypothetical protein AZF37_01255 [endosymbiont 'TC1' of Trimyema compressum]|uniref:NAD(+)/NADH kinase n=1 Tax=endosymbiont 'TC1' of Trimyema compressum TaxID=243899 RepID=UPI0007F08FC0|nr:NAD(+)/NADH kinase [endosymbiont 'TC1' of Trimyema compressum]AMP19988.1 hypothetical protein AZF37_01255 [endosymbiont 'TC1' of Trimyema compressum]